jgi:hypothetical protein
LNLSFSLPRYPEEWIGLREGETEGGYEWLDGTATSHLNWQPGYPEEAGEEEKCVIDGTEFYGNGWKPVNCQSVYGYTCEMAEGATPPPPTIPPTPGATIDCEGFTEDGWFALEGNQDTCYLVKDDLKTWSDAKDACYAAGGLLVSVHSNMENEIVRSQATGQVVSYWMGLYQNTHDSAFSWLDDSVLDFEKWADFEPNDSGGMEGCAHIMPFQG